jgi:uncharacterized membrane protein YfcA
MMRTLLPYLLTSGVLFVSTFTRSALGFGDALVAMPLLALFVGLQTAAPLVALVATTIALVILGRHWQVVEVKTTWRLILALGLGIPPGLLLLRDASEQLMQALLGVLLIAFSLYSLVEPRFELREDRFGLVYGFGFLAGVLGGAYNTAGPLIVVYGHLRCWAPERFRATLQSCFFPAYLMIVIGHGFAGLLTPSVLKLYGLSLPVVLLAIFLGGRCNRTIPREQFARYVNIALMVIGLMLCIKLF